MAVKRMRNPKALVWLQADHIARVRRTANKVGRGRIAIDDVEPDLRRFVVDELDRRGRRP